MRPWILRAAFYPAALGLVGFLLLGQPFADPREPPYWTLRGKTEQGEAIKLRLDSHGRVRTFAVTVDIYCSGNYVSNTGWHPSEGGAPARFSSRGPRFEAIEERTYGQGDGAVIVRGVLRGRVSRDRASGTVEMSRGYDQECDSDPVRWTAD